MVTVTPTILGVGVSIDGADLHAPARGHMPIGVETLQSKHWTGKAHPDWAPDPYFTTSDGATFDRRGVIAVMNCGCGYLPCGGLFVRVKRTPGRVHWAEFWLGMGTVSAREPISFDERQYFDALKRAVRQIQTGS